MASDALFELSLEACWQVTNSFRITAKPGQQGNLFANYEA